MGNLSQAKSILTMEKIVQGTVQNSTSGTSIDFTGIPSWAKKITVMFNGVSTSGVSIPQIQLGSITIQTTGYDVVSQGFNTGTAPLAFTTGFGLADSNDTATMTRTGLIVFNLFTGNIWVGSGSIKRSPGASITNGSVTLSGTLDRIRITTANGTDTFDAGQINIMYEG